MKKGYIGLFILLIIAGGCVKRPKGVMGDKEMASLVADMEIAEAYIQNNPTGQGERERVLAGVLEEHGVSQEKFDSSMAWYGRNVDAYYKLDNQVNRAMAERRRYIAKKAAKEKGETEAMPSADLWPYGRMGVISANSGSRGIDFVLPTTGVDKGERMEWSMRLRSDAEAEGILGVEYESGEKAFVTQANNGRKRFSLTLQTDTGKRVTKVFGNFSLREGARLPLWLDSIALKAMPYDSTEYYKISTARTTGEPKAR